MKAILIAAGIVGVATAGLLSAGFRRKKQIHSPGRLDVIETAGGRH